MYHRLYSFENGLEMDQVHNTNCTGCVLEGKLMRMLVFHFISSVS